MKRRGIKFKKGFKQGGGGIYWVKISPGQGHRAGSCGRAATLDLRIMSSSPMLDIDRTLKKKFFFLVQALWKTVQRFLKKLKIEILYDPIISL